MPLPTRDIVGLMIDNLRRRGSVFPLSVRRSTRWARELGLPDGGETVLYTGAMYQLIPSIISMVRLLERVEDAFLARYVFLGRFANRFVNLSSLMARPSRRDVARYNSIVRDIALLLREAGVEFGYLYGDDLYAGALAHDAGADDTLTAHAQKVHALLQRRGVRRLITVDPHTTNMMRSVYPELLDGYDIEVRSYLEVLAGAGIDPLNPVDADVTIHDSCVYARYEGVIDEPRLLLEAAGYSTRDPEFAGSQTFCCGGPIEALFPSRAVAIGGERVRQLRAAGDGPVATMCPICLATLDKAAAGSLPMEDISALLARACCPAGRPADDGGRPAYSAR
jgi:Fe-S oxidoreductase